MAKLYYYYGAMGSSKTANALMTRFNYEEVGQKALLCKPAMDTRDGEIVVRSRIGLEEPCVLLEDFVKYTEEQIKEYDCIIVDEVQFATREQIDFLSDVVDLCRWCAMDFVRIFRIVYFREVNICLPLQIIFRN